MEENVIIPAGGISLEGRFQAGGASGGALITHPHPLYGGSMDNNVVWTARQACAARKWSSLRFNFRGVGRSTGVYGEGVAEAEDVAAALAFLKERVAGPYWVIGYSFGAAVAARAMLAGLEADGAVLISPPVAFMSMDFLPHVPRLKLIIVGDRDDFCPLDDLYARLSAAPSPVEIAVVAGADHFYSGLEAQLFQKLCDCPFTAPQSL
jgi:alpha/beta superfamily hydrolase